MRGITLAQFWILYRTLLYLVTVTSHYRPVPLPAQIFPLSLMVQGCVGKCSPLTVYKACSPSNGPYRLQVSGSQGNSKTDTIRTRGASALGPASAYSLLHLRGKMGPGFCVIPSTMNVGGGRPGGYPAPTHPVRGGRPGMRPSALHPPYVHRRSFVRVVAIVGLPALSVSRSASPHLRT